MVCLLWKAEPFAHLILLRHSPKGKLVFDRTCDGFTIVQNIFMLPPRQRSANLLVMEHLGMLGGRTTRRKKRQGPGG